MNDATFELINDMIVLHVLVWSRLFVRAFNFFQGYKVAWRWPFEKQSNKSQVCPYVSTLFHANMICPLLVSFLMLYLTMS